MREPLLLASLCVVFLACGGSEFSSTNQGAGGSGTAGSASGAAGSSSGAAGSASGAAGSSSGSAGSSSGAAGSEPGGSAGAAGASGGAGGGQAGAGAAGSSSGAGGSPAGAAGAPAGAGGTTTSGAGGGSSSCASCGAGTYCSKTTGQCEACADFSSLAFGTPVLVAGVDAPTSDPDGHARFPRPTGTNGTGMVYRSGKYNVEKRLNYTADAQGSAGTGIMGSDAVGRSESAPWVLPSGVTGFGNVTLAFDRTKSGVSGDREIFFAQWTAGAPIGTTPFAAPMPINVGPSNYSIAVASATSRIWWMSTRSGQAELLTVNPANPTTSPVDILLNTGCHRNGGDATPWVSADGTLMLFRSFDVTLGNSCAPMGDQNDIWAVRLDDQGKPVAGSAASPLIQTPADETDPALSPDGCFLYFAREDGASGTAEFNIYRAPRE